MPTAVLARVLRAFPYSSDGISIEQMEPGTEAEIRADLVPGLERAGYIEPIIPGAAESRLDGAAPGEAGEGFGAAGGTPPDLEPAPTRRMRGSTRR